MKKIYLSPSDQVANRYAYGGTNEAVQCRKIAAACKLALERNGFEAKTDFTDGSAAMDKRIRESNDWGADMHICIHTNAGGGKGCECYISSKTDDRLKAAKAIYDEIVAISPCGSNRGIKTANYAEIKRTTAKCVYIEADFHDNAKIAEWIVKSTDEIAEAICKGICKYYGKSYKSGVKTAPKTKTTTATTYTVTLPELKRGDKVAQVKTLQRLLKQRGWKDDKGKALEVDGSFGPATEQALKKFQKSKLGGTADGIVGEKTWKVLLEVK